MAELLTQVVVHCQPLSFDATLLRSVEVAGVEEHSAPGQRLASQFADPKLPFVARQGLLVKGDRLLAVETEKVLVVG